MPFISKSHLPILASACLAVLSGNLAAQISVSSGLLDQDNTEALGLTHAPGTQSFGIFKPTAASANKFVNGVVLVGFKGHLYCQWQTSIINEDSGDTHVVYSRSADGETWTAPMVLAPDPVPGTFEYRSSGGWWVHGDTLVAYLNRWSISSPKGGYTEYTTSTDGINWTPIQKVKMLNGADLTGIFEQDPHALPVGGRIINAAHFQPGTTCRPIYTDDPLGVSGWVQATFTTGSGIEPSWFYRSDGAQVMVFRGGSNAKLASVSKNDGQSWTTAATTTIPDSKAKQSAGNLPDGTAYIVSNPVIASPTGGTRRSPLVILLSKNGSVFDRGYLLRRGGGELPNRVYPGDAKTHGYSYPKSTIWNGYLYTGYSVNKEEAACTRVPLASLKTVGLGSKTTTQAEAGAAGGGVTTSTAETGYRGTGFADFPSTGGFVQFNNVSGGAGGQALLTVRFGNGSAATRTGSLIVNGVAQPITFPITTGEGQQAFDTKSNDPIEQADPSWTAWTLIDVSVTLNSGAANTIRFESTGQDLANIDEISVTPATADSIQFAATDSSAGEYGADSALQFTVSRTGDTSNLFIVPLQASGSATAGADYTGLPASVIIPAGQTSSSVNLTAQPDDLAEGPEAVTLGLSPSIFTGGTPANGSIADKPAQDFYFSHIADPSKRGPLDDADLDSQPNILEYFSGSDPDAADGGTIAMTSAGAATFKVRYSRAKNLPDVSGSLRWSADLTHWFSSGQSNGTHTVTFGETVVSESGVDPETVEATATITGAGTPPGIFVRLGVE